MVAKYRVATLGCKVNQYETQQIRELLERLGLTPAAADQPADLTIVNTCAVTATASRKSRQTIRRATRDGQTTVVVVGCDASAEGERLRALPGVHTVLGHDVNIRTELHDLLVHQLKLGLPEARSATPAAVPTVAEHPTAHRDDGWIMPVARLRPRPAKARQFCHTTAPIICPEPAIVKQTSTLTGTIERFDEHQRAFLKVQDGCDARCTYCLIPTLRPRLRSKPITVAVAEARRLVAAGHREIVVTGVFLGAYGRETARRHRLKHVESPLVTLVDALARIEGLQRLRLSSLEPGDVSTELLDVLAGHEVCVPHLHLPLQSGSGDILRRMNRQYSPADYLDMVDRVQTRIDRVALTTDVIVGFPGETGRDFAATLELARQAGFIKIHAFPFSPREGTPAARWKDQRVAPDEVRTRRAELARLEREGAYALRRQLIGSSERVLLERESQAEAGAVRFLGRADRYFQVEVVAQPSSEAGLPELGAVVPVRIEWVTPNATGARLLPTSNARRADSLARRA